MIVIPPESTDTLTLFKSGGRGADSAHHIGSVILQKILCFAFPLGKSRGLLIPADYLLFVCSPLISSSLIHLVFSLVLEELIIELQRCQEI